MCWRIVWKPWVMTQEQVRRPVSLNSHKPQNDIALSLLLQRENGFSPPGGDYEESWLPQGETEKMVWLVLSCYRRWAFELGCVVSGEQPPEAATRLKERHTFCWHQEQSKSCFDCNHVAYKQVWIMTLKRRTFLCPVGGSSEHHCQQGPSEGLRFQELQLPARGPPSLPWGLPAPAVAGHQSNVSRPWLLPGVPAGRWSPPGQSPLGEGVRGQVSDAKRDSYF